MANPQQGQGKGQQKSLSPIFERVVKYAATELAKLQESLSQEAWQYLAFEKRPDVNILMKGDSSFPVASQAFITEIQNDPDAKLTGDEIVSLKEVFSKTAEAIAKAEKKKTEDAEAKAKADKTSGKPKEIHSVADFLAYTIDNEARDERRAILIEFAKLLTPEQRKNFAKGLENGDQVSKFETLVDCATMNDAVVLAELNGWIL